MSAAIESAWNQPLSLLANFGTDLTTLADSVSYGDDDDDDEQRPNSKSPSLSKSKQECFHLNQLFQMKKNMKYEVSRTSIDREPNFSTRIAMSCLLPNNKHMFIFYQ